ncbi:MAG: ATPase [Methanocalculus sp. MSAO_Arc2]|uniref:ATP-binding protein n=1 Tax=Methanocalculus sp. MSAO_Arc2 TaxID=2293855 RepID=UPI000FF83FE6|nr:MAG: ATPase [Methanocalculus sp. MSAO_Arc2]
MKIAIASGKGGTGKSTVAANLAYSLAESRTIAVVDCDVEEPNLHLFFPTPSKDLSVTVKIPRIDLDRCTFCGECGNFCRYGALTIFKDRHLFLPKLCHSCGGCAVICPIGAIHEVDRQIGTVQCRAPSPTMTLISGVLQEGEVQAPPVIKMAKNLAEGHPLILYDAAPGIACPVIETLVGVDFCLLVTESTPFGLHDLKLAHGVAEEIGIPSGVVINRSDGEDEEIQNFCAAYQIPILMTIPFDRGIAAIQNAGNLIAHEIPTWKSEFIELFRKTVAHMEAMQ